MGVAIEGVGLADVDDGVGYWGLAVTVGATGDVGLAADVGVAGTAAVAQLDIRTSAITTPIPVTNAGGRRIRTLLEGEKYLAVDIGIVGELAILILTNLRICRANVVTTLPELPFQTALRKLISINRHCKSQCRFRLV
ncbi:MAG: hypothetical protein M1343_10230 [Chloroflexi bacterium]|nr:hypothetical protein [Chloroflexota bacterium]